VLSNEWNYFRFVVYDDPELFQQDLPFETRFQSIIETIRKRHPFIIPTPRVICKDKIRIHFFNKQHCLSLTKIPDMVSFTNDVLKGGGEGVILQQPQAVYQQGRSNSLLNFKVLLKVILWSLFSILIVPFCFSEFI
jgi:hypothetical protein